MSIALIDYNMGNLGSVINALKFLGAEPVLVSDPKTLSRYQSAILPGVGNFGDGMANLRSRKLDSGLKNFHKQGGKLLGICLGMQMLLEWSEEAPGVPGIGVFRGKVQRFRNDKFKVPQIGWNKANVTKNSPLSYELPSDPYFYFVHSYYVPMADYSLMEAEYIVTFSASIGDGQWFATQFHPEKSQKCGLKLLKNFLQFAGEIK